MAKSLHIRVWDKLYPKQLQIKLDSGYTVKKQAWGQKGVEYGWDIQKIDTKKPNDDITNYKIISFLANQQQQKKQVQQVFVKKNTTAQPSQVTPKQSVQVHPTQSTNSQTQRQAIWTRIFGDKDSGIDFCGRVVNRDTVNGYCDWNTDHIIPLAEGGTNNKSNLQITHVQTNKEKSNKYIFFANGRLWQIKRNNLDIYCQNDNYDYTDCDYCIVEI